ncbi:MAG: amidohydrolase family protein [Raineya sp.]|jgi:imidazolonepropionase-like amidohydrolase|nr:amidohydrolase family protein [Raineya sp.]
MKKVSILFWMFGAYFASAQNPTPAPKQTRPVVIRNATIHIGNGTVVEKGTIVFEQGKITLVDKNIASDLRDAQTIDATGKHVYPGLILPSTTVGLTEVDAVRATRDYYEVGTYNPHVRSLIAFNTDAEMLPTIRYNGVLLVQAAPRGGIISGSSSVMELDGWNWEDAVHKADDGIHMNWIAMYSYNWREQMMEKNNERPKRIAELEQFFTESIAYLQTTNPSPTNLRYEAMRGVFDGSKNLYIHVDEAKEIVESVQFAQKKGVKKIVIVGGSESFRVADFLKNNNIPVLLNRVHSLPNRADDDIDMTYKLPSVLQKAGVLVGLNYEGDMEAMGSRNLAFTAGTAAAYGLDKEEALKMITSNTAKILGIDASVGSLEKGKDATLIISSGDILDMRGNQVEMAFIKGKQIELTSKQTELYQRYKKKYGK